MHILMKFFRYLFSNTETEVKVYICVSVFLHLSCFYIIFILLSLTCNMPADIAVDSSEKRRFPCKIRIGLAF